MPTTLALPRELLRADDFVARYARHRVELVAGIVEELPMPRLQHSKICARFAALLLLFVDAKRCGHVIANDSFIKTRSNPDSVRGPDVCYFSYERLPPGPIADALPDVAPELVIEVRSPSDDWSQLFAKAEEYLQAGVCVVVIVDYETESVAVHRSNAEQVLLYRDDKLAFPDVLPEFSIVVSQLLM
jgi:Uma2 family endonuclease